MDFHLNRTRCIMPPIVQMYEECLNFGTEGPSTIILPKLMEYEKDAVSCRRTMVAASEYIPHA